MVKDDQGLNNRVQMFLAYDGSTETVDALIGVWTAYGALIDACIDGKIVDGRITIPLVRNAAWKATPANGNNANQVMALNFNNDFNTYATAIELPTYKEALLDANKLPIISAAGPLKTLIDAIIAGQTSAFPNSRDLHDLSALRDAFLTVRKVKRQRTKTRVSP